MSSPYVKGRGDEYRTLAKLRKEGFTCFRQPRSAFPDIIAIQRGAMNPREIRLIESRRDGYLSPGEREAIKKMAEEVGAKAYVRSRGGKIAEVK